MTQKMFSIRDSKGEFYSSPFYKKTDAEAQRDFATLVRDGNNQVSKYPEDFDLYFIGTFDDITGKVDALATPHHVIKATALIN